MATENENISASEQVAIRTKASRVDIQSTLDGVMQACRVWHAEGDEPRPLLVVLHTWGGTFEQPLDNYIDQAFVHNWHCIMPDFRGRNIQPDACGSPKARQDVLDAVDWAENNLDIDADRIYLVGGSGGGHMTMRMCGQSPKVFAAASAWCGITDLAAWYAEHVKDGVEGGYAKNVVASIGGVPGSSPEVDKEIVDRSPLPHMHNASKMHLDIAHGIHDGKKGSVPFWHSIWAYNRIAAKLGEPEVTQSEIEQLWNQGRLDHPQLGETDPDPTYSGRQIYLRRRAGNCRLTIFDGAHEVLPSAACDWLARHSLAGTVPVETRRVLKEQDGEAQIPG